MILLIFLRILLQEAKYFIFNKLFDKLQSKRHLFVKSLRIYDEKSFYFYLVIPMASKVLTSPQLNEQDKNFRKALEEFYLNIRDKISKESLSKLPTNDLAFLLNFINVSEQGIL